MAQGLSNQEIAQRLGLTPWTVEFHVGNILPKSGVISRLEAVLWAKAHRFLRPVEIHRSEARNFTVDRRHGTGYPEDATGRWQQRNRQPPCVLASARRNQLNPPVRPALHPADRKRQPCHRFRRWGPSATTRAASAGSTSRD